MHKKRILTSAPALSVFAIFAISGTLWTEAQIRTVEAIGPSFEIVSDDGAEFELSDNATLPEHLKKAVHEYVGTSKLGDIRLISLDEVPAFSTVQAADRMAMNAYLGRVLASKNRFDEALKVLSSLSEDERQKFDSSFAYAETLKGLGNVEAANAAYEVHISNNGAHQAGHINYAIFLADQEKYQDAIVVLERAIGITSGNRKGKSYALLGITQSKLGNFIEAEAAFEESIRFRPGHGATWRRLADARSKLANFAQGDIISTFQKSDAVAPGNAITKQDFAAYYFSVGRFDEALPLYRDASKLAPEKTGLLLERVQNLIASERPSAARRLLKKIKAQRLSTSEKGQVKILDLVLNGKQSSILKFLDSGKARQETDADRFNLLLAFLDVGDFENAKKTASGLSEHSTYSEPSRFLLGRSLYRAGRYADASTLFSELTKSNELSPAYWLYLGRAHTEKSELDSALKAIGKAYALYPGSGRVVIDYSKALSNVGDRTRAAEVLFSYLEENQKDSRALTALAEFYVSGKNYDRAEQLYKVVYELQSDNMRVAKGLARVQIEAGRPASAIRTLGRIIAQEPSDTEARLMRARANDALGDTQAAIFEYQAVLKLDARNETAKTELQKIGG